MKFINYTNDGRVVVQHAALILSKLDETDTLELHTMDNAIILLKKDRTIPIFQHRYKRSLQCRNHQTCFRQSGSPHYSR